MPSIPASPRRRLKIVLVSVAAGGSLVALAVTAWPLTTGGEGNRITFEAMSAYADRVALPAQTVPYLAGNSENRATFCPGEVCPALRRAYIIPAPVGQEATLVTDLLQSAGLAVTKRDEADCFSGRLMSCNAESRQPGLLANATAQRLGPDSAIPVPNSPAPPGSNWALLHLDLRAAR